jgi:hypothetical protein
MRTLYRIFTENKNPVITRDIINSYFDGYTLIEATGYWHSQPENTLIIEIMAKIGDRGKVLQICEAIKRQNNQEAVLLQTLCNIHGELV